MFASLRNKFSNYRTCSLRFDIEENIIIEAFASLNVFERVYTIEACASGRLIHRDQCAYLLATPRITDTRSRRLPVSLIRGVVFQIGISNLLKSERLEEYCEGPIPNRFMQKRQKNRSIVMSL